MTISFGVNRWLILAACAPWVADDALVYSCCRIFGFCQA